MPKTPSLTVAEAETAIGVPRGHGRVTSQNRGLFRKWLTARGIPSLATAGLSITELGLAYNDTTDAQFARIREKIERAKREDGIEDDAGQDEPIPSDMPAPEVRVQHPGAATSVQGQDKVTQALAVLQGLMGNQGVDEAAVSKIVDQRIADALREIPTARLDIKIGERPTVQVEGARHEAFERILIALTAGVNVMLVGPAGCGKTHVCEQAARAMQTGFGFTGAVASEYKLLGFTDAHGRTVRTSYRDSYERGGVFLWDELDGSSPSAMLAFNAGLANGHQDFPDGAINRHADFRAIASANTYGNGADRLYVGRNQMDAASLDRFFVIPMDYDERMERALYGDTEWLGYVHKVRAAVRALGLRHVVSMRAIDQGARLLAAGMDRASVEQGALWKGLAPADVAKIKAGM
jgi:cobaltochelatase CobS